MGATYVYRLWDDGGSLLYVGISKTLINRLAQHDAQQPWADEVASVTAVRYPTRSQAARAEEEAIAAENPRYNIRHAKKPSKVESAQQLWEQMSESERAEAARLLGRLASNWPQEWHGDANQRLRGHASTISALLSAGNSPAQAFGVVFPGVRDDGKAVDK